MKQIINVLVMSGLLVLTPVLYLVLVRPVEAQSATYIKTDTTTQGNWPASGYAADGYQIMGGASALPAYAKITPANNAQWVWNPSTSDVRAILTTPTGVQRIAACWYNNSFTVNVAISDGQSHQLALYAVDWDGQGRSESITIKNSSGTVLNAQTISSFGNGKWLLWTVSGNITLTIAANAGPNAVVSFIGFATPASGPSVSVSPAQQNLTLSTPANIAVTVTGQPGQIVMFSVPNGGTIPSSGTLSGILGVDLIPPPTGVSIITPSFPPVYAGKNFSYQMLAAGGTAPYSWSLTKGSLPAGLSMNISGFITGTPTGAAGTIYTFTITVTDASGVSASLNIT